MGLPPRRVCDNHCSHVRTPCRCSLLAASGPWSRSLSEGVFTSVIGFFKERKYVRRHCIELRARASNTRHITSLDIVYFIGCTTLGSPQGVEVRHYNINSRSTIAPSKPAPGRSSRRRRASLAPARNGRARRLRRRSAAAAAARAAVSGAPARSVAARALPTRRRRSRRAGAAWARGKTSRMSPTACTTRSSTTTLRRGGAR